jgi:hypothetical protein
MIGTASKGIIDRPFQHNAQVFPLPIISNLSQVYRQLYAPNPFASETDEDIRKYIREVESKPPRPGSASEPRADSPSAGMPSPLSRLFAIYPSLSRGVWISPYRDYLIDAGRA